MRNAGASMQLKAFLAGHPCVDDLGCCREASGSSASAQDLCCKVILSDVVALASLCQHSLQDLAPHDEHVAEFSQIIPRHAMDWICLPKLWQVGLSLTT